VASPGNPVNVRAPDTSKKGTNRFAEPGVPGVPTLWVTELG